MTEVSTSDAGARAARRSDLMQAAESPMVRRIGLDAFNGLRKASRMRLRGTGALIVGPFLVVIPVIVGHGRLPEIAVVVLLGCYVLLALPGGIVLSVLGAGTQKRAELSAAAYLHAEDYASLSRIPAIFMRGRPEDFDRFLSRAGIPLPPPGGWASGEAPAPTKRASAEGPKKSHEKSGAQDDGR